MDLKKVQRLVKLLMSNIDLYELPCYRVIERGIRRETSYILLGITAEEENGELYFYDAEEHIYNEANMLIGLVIDNIEDIIFNKNKYVIKLKLDRGEITINLIK